MRERNLVTGSIDWNEDWGFVYSALKKALEENVSAMRPCYMCKISGKRMLLQDGNIWNGNLGDVDCKKCILPSVEKSEYTMVNPVNSAIFHCADWVRRSSNIDRDIGASLKLHANWHIKKKVLIKAVLTYIETVSYTHLRAHET